MHYRSEYSKTTLCRVPTYTWGGGREILQCKSMLFHFYSALHGYLWGRAKFIFARGESHWPIKQQMKGMRITSRS